MEVKRQGYNNKINNISDTASLRNVLTQRSKGEGAV